MSEPIRAAVVPHPPALGRYRISAAIDGQGSEEDPDIVCGACGTVLVRHASPRVKFAGAGCILCYGCGAANNLDPSSKN